MSKDSASRIALAGIIHETNTYAADSFGMTKFASFEQYEGVQIIEHFTHVNHQVGGFIEGADKLNVQLIPTYLAQATPSGTIEYETYQKIKNKILAGIQQIIPVDGVLLALHGAGVADGIEDIEGDLLESIRALVGPHIPIAAEYDLHTNFTPRMHQACDLTITCKLYPHTDFLVRGIETIQLLSDLIDGKIKPTSAVKFLPILPYIVTTDVGFIPSEVNKLCEQLAQKEGVLDCAWFHGFPYADIASPCPAVICTTDNNPELAEECANTVARWIWGNKAAFLPEFSTPEGAIEKAFSKDSKTRFPIVLNEYSDNPGGGTPGDGTYLLKAILDSNPAPASVCFAIMNDQAVVQQAIKAGVGATILVSLGGKLGPYQGEPIQTEAYVKAITDGKFINKPEAMFEGVSFDLGKMCRLIIKGIDVIVASRAEQVYDDVPFLLHGIDIQTYKIVALKGANHFRAWYSKNAGEIISVNAKGLSSADIKSFPRHHLKTHVWPLDENVKF